MHGLHGLYQEHTNQCAMSSTLHTNIQVLGQTQDLVDLQRILLRGTTKLSDQAQQNMTRWAVYNAASLLRQYGKEYEALVEAMKRGAPVDECIAAIESA